MVPLRFLFCGVEIGPRLLQCVSPDFRGRARRLGSCLTCALSTAVLASEDDHVGLTLSLPQSPGCLVILRRPRLFQDREGCQEGTEWE